MVKIVWTEISRSDLEDIHDYIFQDSEKYAWIIANKIYQEVQILISNPIIGRIVPEFNDRLIREIITGKYRIIYRITNEYQVDILRVYHSARLLKKSSLTKNNKA